MYPWRELHRSEVVFLIASYQMVHNFKCPITDDNFDFLLRWCLPGSSTVKLLFFPLWLTSILEGSYAHHYTNTAQLTNILVFCGEIF